MGWWGFDVLGGDAPLDILHGFAEVLGVPDEEGEVSLYPLEFSEERRSKLSTAINRKWLELLDELSQYSNSKWSDDLNIANQVLAAVIMATGANMPEPFKKAARNAVDDDYWANEGEHERREALLKFDKKLEAYEGSPVELEHTSLLARFAEVLGA
jgi:hypothetical protein